VQKLLGTQKVRKLRKYRGGATILTPWFGVQHVVDTPFLLTPFGFFPLEIWYPSLANTASVSIRIYPEKEKVKKRYSGKWNPNMLADYCWKLVRRHLQ
jgi:hypothetical protein